MLHACVARFDVTVNLKKFEFLGELNKAAKMLLSFVLINKLVQYLFFTLVV